MTPGVKALQAYPPGLREMHAKVRVWAANGFTFTGSTMDFPFCCELASIVPARICSSAKARTSCADVPTNLGEDGHDSVLLRGRALSHEVNHFIG
jgi:hypothetical protein